MGVECLAICNTARMGPSSSSLPFSTVRNMEKEAEAAACLSQVTGLHRTLARPAGPDADRMLAQFTVAGGVGCLDGR